MAHAGEEGPAQNITDAIEMLEVSRVDHGVRCVEDEALVESLIETKMPLTVCRCLTSNFACLMKWDSTTS